MTGNTPMSGRDTAAAFKGLIVGFVAIAVVVLTLVFWTNSRFAGHGEPGAAESTH